MAVASLVLEIFLPQVQNKNKRKLHFTEKLLKSTLAEK